MRNLEIAKKKLDKLADEIGNGKIYYRHLVRRLNEEFQSLKVGFGTREVEGLNGYIVCNGYYNGDLRELRRAGLGDSPVLSNLYTIEICRSAELEWVKPRQHAFFREVYFILAHEFRHAYQRRRRNFKKRLRKNPAFRMGKESVREQVQYLIQYDEIDAYAFEAACELHERGLPFSDLKLTSVYRMMYGRSFVRRFALKHFKRWVRKVHNNLNNITFPARQEE